MTLQEKLMSIILESGKTVNDVAVCAGLSPVAFCKKLEHNSLNVRDANAISKALKLQNPSEVFFT